MPTGIYPHKPRSEATRKKLSLAFKGRVVSEQTRKKQSDAAKKRFENPESRIKQGLIRKGTRLSNDHRKKISDANKGKLKGKSKPPLSEEHRSKISLAMKGRVRSPEYCKRISEGKLGKPRPDMVGENNPVWNGGTSFEPYCPKFNHEFKERVRAFFGYTCQKCGATKRLQVHHIVPLRHGGNDDPSNLITVCPKCHKSLDFPLLIADHSAREAITNV